MCIAERGRWYTSSARSDFAIHAAVAHARDKERACRLACAIGHGRRARHLDSGSRATSRSRAHQRKWRSRTHTSLSVFVSNNTNTNQNYDHQSGMGGSQSAALRRTQSSHFKFADLSKLPARFGRFRPNYCHFARVVRVVRVKIASRFGHCIPDRPSQGRWRVVPGVCRECSLKNIHCSKVHDSYLARTPPLGQVYSAVRSDAPREPSGTARTTSSGRSEGDVVEVFL